MNRAHRTRIHSTTVDDRLLLTVEEAADLLGIGRTLTYQLIRDGDLTTVKVGRLRRVPARALHAWIATASGTPDVEAV